jgi:DNA-binding MarR family transcriptional regulator
LAIVARRIESPNLLLQTYIVDQLVGALLVDAMADAELAPGEFAVQSVIGAFGPIMPSELAQMLGIPPTTLSAHLRRFTDRDHLVRTPNPSDGRSYLVTLSAKGRAAVTKAHSALERTLQDVHRQLEPRSADAIGEALAQFEQALRAAQGTRAERLLRERTN